MTPGESQALANRIDLDALKDLPIVEVHFKDHVQSSTHLFDIQATGYLLHRDKKSTILITWLPINVNAEDVKANWEVFTLVSSAITKIIPLSRRRRKNVRNKAR